MTSWRLTLAAVGLCAVVAAAPGCSPRYAASGDDVTIEVLCERSLADLTALIDERAASPDVSAGAIAEARALRDVATDLYLDGNSNDALDFIDQAFRLLGRRK